MTEHPIRRTRGHHTPPQRMHNAYEHRGRWQRRTELGFEETPTHTHMALEYDEFVDGRIRSQSMDILDSLEKSLDA